ncbi:MAG: YcxB family protein [Anaerofustis stercorihominis]|nr:YcxB family protein [Anaerofustis stercorihominis]
MKRLEADVALSYEGYKTFCKFNSMRNKNYKYANARIYVILGAIFAVTLYMILSGKYGANIWIMIGLCGIFGGYYYKALVTAPKKQYETVKQAYSGKKYIITEEAFEVHEGENADIFNFDEILKIYEIEKYFYVYITNALCLVVDKSLFTAGTPEDFAELAQEALGSFFIKLE